VLYNFVRGPGVGQVSTKICQYAFEQA